MNKVSKEVQDILDAHKDVINMEPVLMLDILEQQRARNKGYPKWLYHETREPVMVINSAQEKALKAEFGFQLNYIIQNFPCHMFRRNMDPKFKDSDLDNGRPGGFIERRLVRNKAALKALETEYVPDTVVGDWVEAVTMLPAIRKGPDEDPRITIARLEGQLKAQRTESEEEPELALAGGKKKRA